jgi:hypothetical protein
MKQTSPWKLRKIFATDLAILKCSSLDLAQKTILMHLLLDFSDYHFCRLHSYKNLFQPNLFLLAELNPLLFQHQKYEFSFFHYSILQNLQAPHDFWHHWLLRQSTRKHASVYFQRLALMHFSVAKVFQYPLNLHQINLSFLGLFSLIRHYKAR